MSPFTHHVHRIQQKAFQIGGLYHYTVEAATSSTAQRLRLIHKLKAVLYRYMVQLQLSGSVIHYMQVTYLIHSKVVLKDNCHETPPVWKG